MKEKFKKYAIALLALLMLFGQIPLLSQVVKAADDKVKVTVHKRSVPEGTELKQHFGEELTDPPGKPLSSVRFAYWKLPSSYTKEKIKELDNIKTYKEAIKYFSKAENGNLEPTFLVDHTTDNDGIVNYYLENNGKYFFVEQGVINVSDGTFPEGGQGSGVTGFIGAPFIISLPMADKNGKPFSINNPMHVYPKNIIDGVELDLIKVDSEGKQLSGAEFLLERYDLYDNGNDAWQKIQANIPAGKITLTNLAIGEYRLTETKAPEGYMLNKTPIYFEITPNNTLSFDVEANKGGIDFTTEKNEDSAHYTVKVANELIPEIDKVVDDNQNSATHTVGEIQSWTIKPSIPKYIKDFKVYTITDTLDYRLTFVTMAPGDESFIEITDDSDMDLIYSAVNVTLAGKGMQPKVDYTIEYTPFYLQDPNDIPSNSGTIKVDFTESGRKVLQKHIDDGGKASALNISFDTVINDWANNGDEIENNAKLDFDNSQGSITVPEPTNPGEITPPEPPIKPEVHLGGQKFVKTDKLTEQKLAGAKFMITTDPEGKKPLVWTKPLKRINEDAIDNGLFETPAKVGQPIIMISGEDGSFEISGLAYGTYYLVETQAPEVPEGEDPYNPIKDPIAFEITKSSYDDSKNLITVENAKGTKVPETGGIGTVLFTAIGALLIGGAVIYTRKKKLI